MSTLKDRLASSVRQAKSAAGQHRAAEQPRAVERTPPAPAVPARGAAALAVAGIPSSPDAQNPAPSAPELFPRRVWPD